MEIRIPGSRASDFKVLAESAPHGLKGGDPVWRILVPANDQRTLAVTVEAALD